MLEKDGFLQLTKTGGVRVVQPSLEDFRYLFECRIEMESAAAFYAATRRTEEQLKIIEDSIDRFSSVQIDNQSSATNGFHDLIIEASMNTFLIQMLRQVRGVNSFYRKTIVDTNPKRIHPALKEHEEIYIAIANCDQALARKLMRKHIENDYQVFISLTEEKTEESFNGQH